MRAYNQPLRTQRRRAPARSSKAPPIPAPYLDRAVAVARRMEYEAAVTAEVNRRLAELTAAIHTPTTGADQRLRDVHAEPA